MPETVSAFEKTVSQQRLVSTPTSSAWVAANAGAGKTKVLTDRVMRLLLAGAAPSRILCITFTKAAAAEMAERLFRRLGEWALMNDEGLMEQLADLDEKTGRSADELSTARRLFARALETPGGLKIQTIHSFCESVLKRFPLEAGVSPGFTVLEDQESQRSLHEIINTLAVDIWQQDETAYAEFLELTRKFDEQSLRRDIFSLSSKAQLIRKAMAAAGGEEAYWQQIKSGLGVSPGEVPGDWQGAMLDSLDRPALEAAYSALLVSNKTDKARAEHLRLLLDARDPELAFEAARKCLLTAQGKPLSRLAGKDAKAAMPDIETVLSSCQEAVVAVLDKCRSFEICRQSRALHRLALAADDRFSTFKKNGGYLDFDDLIFRTVELFETTAPSWVLYKLDQGIDHILLDEAQDTSDGQWQVVMQPLNEFFTGTESHDIPRSVFVVGDEKQSIYSFQGADVGLFRSQQSELAGLIIPSGQQFNVQNLVLSFRSSPPVLQFVDEVFSEPAAAKGVSEQTSLQHFSNRADDAGLVELWPLIERQDGPKGNPWDAPVDMPDAADPSRQLAEHIASTIARWLADGEILEAKGRAIQPGDIMILCQQRGPVFHEIVRALARRKVPTSGADRIKLKEHVAVMDMMSAARFCLQAGDDLSLAELLKSPLFGFVDGDLFALAYDRRGHQSLWQSLCGAAAKDTSENRDSLYADAAETIKAAKSISLRHGPYAFFTYLLESGSPSGWQRFYQRLGTGVREVLGEFLNEVLNFEAGEPRTLQGFCAYMDQLDSDLKREIDGTEGLVRVMTVHGSKGLEADIVFLADAAYANFTKGISFLPVDPNFDAERGRFSFSPQDGYPLRVTAKSDDSHYIELARDHAASVRAEEYRRLFYVAATRARDRLYICGQTQGKASKAGVVDKPPEQASWYALAARAFERLAQKGVVEPGGELPWGGEAICLRSSQVAEAEPCDTKTEKVYGELPAWLSMPVQSERVTRRLRPSRIAAEDPEFPQLTAPEVVFDPAAVTDGGIPAYTRGNALHLLLEKLPELPTAQREAAAFNLLQKNYADVPQAIREEWVTEIQSILSNQDFRDVFSEKSRAEVPVIGSVSGPDGDRIISGQIDRLLVTDDRILIVDYKTNRPPPKNAQDVPAEYILQLAAYRKLLQEIYPDRKVSCALLWTWQARLMEIPEDMLSHAFVH